MGNLRLKHLILPFIFGLIVLSAANYERKIGPIHTTGGFAVALNQLYTHCNHRGWQEVRIILTMHGISDKSVLVEKIYVSYDDGKRHRLLASQFELILDSGDRVKEMGITLTTNDGTLLDESKHGKVPYITIVLSHDGYTFWIKNSGPTW